MSNDTNSYQPAHPDGMGTSQGEDSDPAASSLLASAVRGCSLISTVFGSKSPGGGREEG